MMLDEIAAYLATEGLGEIDHEIFKGARPDTPDACIVVSERPSLPPIGTQDSSISQERPRLMVVVRGVTDDYLGPRAIAEKIYRVLATIRSMTLSGATYIAVVPSPPYPIGRDENARYLICVNAEVTKTPS